MENPSYAKMILLAVALGDIQESNLKIFVSLNYIKKYLEANYKIESTDKRAMSLVKRTLKSLSDPSLENPPLQSKIDKKGRHYHMYTLSHTDDSNCNVVQIKKVEPGLEMRGKKWVPEEDEKLKNPHGAILVDYLKDGSFEELAKDHKRTEKAIKCRVMIFLSQQMSMLGKIELNDSCLKTINDHKITKDEFVEFVELNKKTLKTSIECVLKVDEELSTTSTTTTAPETLSTV